MIKAQRKVLSLLRAWTKHISHLVNRWEAAGREITLQQVRDTLVDLEVLVEARVFERSEAFDQQSLFEAEIEFEMEMILKGVERLRVAAEPVIADADAEREAERLRRTFTVIDSLAERRAG